MVQCACANQGTSACMHPCSMCRERFFEGRNMHRKAREGVWLGGVMQEEVRTERKDQGTMHGGWEEE